MDSRLNCSCAACGHVWTLLHFPVTVQQMRPFAKLPCPKCYAPKPKVAVKHDLTAEDRHTALLRRAHDAMSRRDPDGISDAEWDQLLADIAAEVGPTSSPLADEAER